MDKNIVEDMIVFIIQSLMYEKIMDKMLWKT